MADDTFDKPPGKLSSRFPKIIIPAVEIILLAVLLVIGIFFANAVLSPSLPKKVEPVEFDTDDLLDAEDLKVSAQSRSFPTAVQDTKAFVDGKWKRDSHLFAWEVKQNDWIEWKIPVSEKGEYRIFAHLTRALDYGIVQISRAGKPIGPKIDLWASDFRIKPTGPVDLGTYHLRPPEVKLRLEVVGRNEKNSPPYYQFGIDGFVLEDVSE